MTVQYEGEAFLLTGRELVRYQQVLFAIWPDGADRLSWPGIVFRRASQMDPLQRF